MHTRPFYVNSIVYRLYGRKMTIAFDLRYDRHEGLYIPISVLAVDIVNKRDGINAFVW